MKIIPYTEEEDAILIDCLERGLSASQTAAKLPGRTGGGVRSRARTMGLLFGQPAPIAPLPLDEPARDKRLDQEYVAKCIMQGGFGGIRSSNRAGVTAVSRAPSQDPFVVDHETLFSEGPDAATLEKRAACPGLDPMPSRPMGFWRAPDAPVTLRRFSWEGGQ